MTTPLLGHWLLESTFVLPQLPPYPHRTDLWLLPYLQSTDKKSLSSPNWFFPLTENWSEKDLVTCVFLKMEKTTRKYARLENANFTLISRLEVLIKLGIRPCNQNFRMAEAFWRLSNSTLNQKSKPLSKLAWILLEVVGMSAAGQQAPFMEI